MNTPNTASPSGPANTGPSLRLLLNEMANNMKFLGTVEIVLGALFCLSIIWAIVGIPSILAGIRLRNSADSYRHYLNSDDVGLLHAALEQQSRFFSIQKILTIGLIVLLTINVVLLFGKAMLFGLHRFG